MHFLCLQMIFFNLRVLFTSLNTQLTDSKMHCYGVFLALFIFTSGTFIAGSVVIINIIGSLVSISKPFQFNADFRIAKQKSTENGGNKHSRLRSWWWWSNGQRTYLLLRQSKFISGRDYNFYCIKLFKKGLNRGRGCLITNTIMQDVYGSKIQECLITHWNWSN